MKRKNRNKKAVPTQTLTTPWTASVSAENVWKEYPRPAMVRDGWINLNGLWDYAFTEGPDTPESFDGKILVPFSPESPLSGVNRQLQPQEYLWYRRSVTVRRPETVSYTHLKHWSVQPLYCTGILRRQTYVEPSGKLSHDLD